MNVSEQKKSIIARFLKFGSLENLTKLRAGQVHMKTLGYFRDLEEKDGRGDKYEALFAHLQPGQFRLRLGDLEIPAEDLAGPMTMSRDADADIHVFCMTALTVDHINSHEGRSVINEQLLEWGPHVLMIKPRPFLERMAEAVRTAGFKHEFAPVQYYDPASFHGNASPFHKRSSYEWQMEARIIATPSGEKFRNIELGSLEDITELLDLAAPDVPEP